MNDEELNQLFKTVRNAAPDTSRAEYGFETRLLARIREERRGSSSIFGWAWRLCPYFSALVAALAVWTWFSPLDLDLQAIASNGEDGAQLMEFFTGE